MLPLNLTIGALILLALYVLTGFIQALRKNVRAGCWSHFLLGLAVLMFVASFILNAQTQEPAPLLTPIAAGSIGGLAILSIIILVLERRKNEFKALYSRALLGLGVSAMLAISFFVTPIIPSQILIEPTSTPVSVAQNQPAGNIVPTQIAQDEPTEIITLEPTITRTPLPLPSPTRTRRAYEPPTSTPTPELEVVQDACDAQVLVNLNVREEPTTDANIVAIIPADRFVRILGKNNDGSWWRTEFEGEQGWIAEEFITLDPICLVE